MPLSDLILMLAAALIGILLGNGLYKLGALLWARLHSDSRRDPGADNDPDAIQRN